MSNAKDPANPRLRGRNRPTHPRRLAAEQLAAQAFQLRLHGHTFAAIAVALGKPMPTVKAAYQRSLMRTRSETDVAREQLRAMEVARLDHYLSKMAPQIDKGDERAIDRAIRIADRRAKLLGLDAPTKIAPVTPDGANEYQPAAVTSNDVLARVLKLIETAQARRDAAGKAKK